MISESQPGVITHFIAGYPSYDISLDVARGLIAGGAFALEMQIPFSDPSADGPVIEGPAGMPCLPDSQPEMLFNSLKPFVPNQTYLFSL